MKKILVIMAATLLAGCRIVLTPTPGVTLVENGQTRAVIVIADEANTVAVYAAEELAKHIKLATGVDIGIVPESAIPAGYGSRVFVGDTSAARHLGINPDELANDEFILRTAGRDLYVLGKEDPSRVNLMSGPENSRVLESGFYTGRGETSPNGTLFGVYELLDRHVGVRWLWPGELGTYVPRADSIVMGKALDEKHSPKIGFRRFAWSAIGNAGRLAEERKCNGSRGRIGRLKIASNLVSRIEGLTFSAPVLVNYYKDLGVFLGRHRLGYSIEKPHLEWHQFHHWWQTYGKKHPEWFMLREDGERGPLRPESEFATLCVSDASLHRFIVEEAWKGGDYLNLGEADVRGVCLCEHCLAWDGPQPQEGEYPSGVRQDYNPRMASDRYARFWSTIQKMAAKKNPNVTVTTYLYWNYFPAPTSDIKLNRKIYGEFAPWTQWTGYYPMSDELDRWVREQWLGWKRTGIRMAYRPNNFHGGYVMPEFSTWQAGEFFQFAYENGMEGFFFDSLYGHWATKGPMLYMYMRLAWHPDMDIKEIRQEYFEAFGPAAEEMERYFDYWEDRATRKNPIWWSGTAHAGRLYPSRAFDEGGAILKDALDAARRSPKKEYAERVEFIKLGLEHARLAAAFMNTTDLGKAPSNMEKIRKARRALDELIEFRKRHEHTYFADLMDAAGRETTYVDFKNLLTD